MESESNAIGNENEAGEATARGACPNPSYQPAGCCLAKKLPLQGLKAFGIAVQLIALVGVSWVPHKYLFPYLETAIGNDIEAFGVLIAAVFTFGTTVLFLMGEKVHRPNKVRWLKKMAVAGLIFVLIYFFSRVALGISSVFDCGEVPEGAPEVATLDSSEKKEL